MSNKNKISLYYVSSALILDQMRKSFQKDQRQQKN